MEGANEIIGWVGSILFSICGAPQAFKTFKTKRVEDLSIMFLMLWFWGEVFTLFYIVYGDIASGNYHIPLYFNYAFNLVIVVYLIWARYTYPKKFQLDTV